MVFMRLRIMGQQVFMYGRLTVIWTHPRYLQDHPHVKFSGVLCYDEYGLLLAAHLAEHIGLSYLSSVLVESVRDKYKVSETRRA